MADLRPLHALRYDVSKVGALSDVTTPPYDVIDAELQRRLEQRSPYNFIRLELTPTQPGDGPEDRYRRAAAILADWRRTGILTYDSAPAYYLYRQTFETETGTHVRTGFLGRVRVDPFGVGSVYPHEQTLSGPKADRLALYRATGCNLSPVFGLYPDDRQDVIRTVEAGVKDKTPSTAIDHLGVKHEMWRVDDLETHAKLQALMADKPIFIADGHHRYETSVADRDAFLAEHPEAADDLEHPCRFALMMFVGMSDPGLLILPTHRLVSGLPGLTAETLAARLAPEFDVEPVDSQEAAWTLIDAQAAQEVFGFGTRADGRWLLARLRSDDTMDRLAADQSPDGRALGVSILHRLVLDHLLADLGTPRCRYVHTLAETRADLADPEGCDLACLVAPATMDQVATLASRLEKMPAKSTYFYPKLLSGLVISPIRRDHES